MPKYMLLSTVCFETSKKPSLNPHKKDLDAACIVCAHAFSFQNKQKFNFKMFTLSMQDRKIQIQMNIPFGTGVKPNYYLWVEATP